MSNRVTDKDKGWKKHKRMLKKQSTGVPHVKVGILGPDANQSYAETDATVILVASVHEFGSGTVSGRSGGMKVINPERSFIRGTFDAKKKDFQKTMRILADAVLTNKMSQRRALGLFGEKVVADTKTFMAAGIDPPKKDGSTSRLKDTGQLYGSLTFEVVAT